MSTFERASEAIYWWNKMIGKKISLVSIACDRSSIKNWFVLHRNNFQKQALGLENNDSCLSATLEFLWKIILRQWSIFTLIPISFLLENITRAIKEECYNLFHTPPPFATLKANYSSRTLKAFIAFLCSILRVKSSPLFRDYGVT